MLLLEPRVKSQSFPSLSALRSSAASWTSLRLLTRPCLLLSANCDCSAVTPRWEGQQELAITCIETIWSPGYGRTKIKVTRPRTIKLPVAVALCLLLVKGFLWSQQMDENQAKNEIYHRKSPLFIRKLRGSVHWLIIQTFNDSVFCC